MEEIFSGDPGKRWIVGKDAESIPSRCPVADIQTLFLIKLNSDQERDLLDLLIRTGKFGVPEHLDTCLWITRQRKNLEFIREWIQIRQRR